MTQLDSPPTRPLTPPLPPLIGCKEELRTLMNHVESARAGRGGMVAIRAASGFGKTRLIHQIAQDAQRMDTAVALIGCRGSLHRPYQPLAEMARQILSVNADDAPDEQYSALEKALFGLNLSEITPPLARLLGLPTGSRQSAPPASSEDDEIPEMSGGALPDFVDPLARLLGRLAERQRAVCLLFDDIDEAHPTTHLILSEIRDRLAPLEGQPILLIVALAPSAAPELQRPYGESVVQLAGLRRREAVSFAASLLGVKKLSLGLVDALVKHAEGNALYITLRAEALRDAGRITRGETEAQAALILDDEEPAPSLPDLIRQRAAKLTPIARTALECASVLADGFRLGALAELTGRNRAEVRTDLNPLLAGSWLEPCGQGSQAGYRFAGRARRSAIYESLPAERRGDLHLKAGEYYAAPGASWRLRPEEAMYHFLKAGRPGRAVPVIEMAISQARAADDQPRVIALHRLGVEVAEADAALVDKQAAMAEGLGDLYAAAGDYARAAEAYGQLAPTVKSVPLVAKLGLVTLALDPARAANILNRALSALHGLENDDLRWRVEAGRSWALALSGHSYEAIRHSRDALASLKDTMGFGMARTLLRGTLGMVMFYDGDESEAHPHLESARAGWGAHGEQDGVMMINQVLISMPKIEVTRAWLRLALRPLLKK